MTKSQQLAVRALREAQETYLRAYGWTYVRAYKLWMHPRLTALGSICMDDALAQTRANPMIGWP